MLKGPEVPLNNFGRAKSCLTCLSLASDAVREEPSSPDTPGDAKDKSLPTSRSAEQLSNSKASTAPKRKKRIKSTLLNSYIIWALVRIAVPGEGRQTGQAVNYQLNRVVLTIKLFTRTIVIDSVKQNDNVSSRRSYPIVAQYRNMDLKSYFDSLYSIEGWNDLLSNSQVKPGIIQSKDHPLTIPIITLPYRLPGFKLDVISQMLVDLNSLLEVKSDTFDVAFTAIENRATLAKVHTQTADNGKEIYTINENALSKPLVREIRSILNSLSSSKRLSSKVLNLIKIYLYILKTALTLLNRQAALVDKM